MIKGDNIIMLKNTQIKIILIFTILDVVVLMGLGLLFSHNLDVLSNTVSSGSIETTEQIVDEINKENEQIKKMTFYFIGIFVIVSNKNCFIAYC